MLDGDVISKIANKEGTVSIQALIDVLANALGRNSRDVEFPRCAICRCVKEKREVIRLLGWQQEQVERLSGSLGANKGDRVVGRMHIQEAMWDTIVHGVESHRKACELE